MYTEYNSHQFSLVNKDFARNMKMFCGSEVNSGEMTVVYIDEKPIGIVSVTNSLIENLYVLPDLQNMGYGTKLLQFAISQCSDTPALWILENNTRAEKLYRRMGFKKTGKRNSITDVLDEIEYSL